MPSRQSVSIKPSFKKIGTVVRTMFSFKDGTVDEKRRNRCLVALYEADQIKYYEPSDIAFVLFPTRLILESKNILESDNASRINNHSIDPNSAKFFNECLINDCINYQAANDGKNLVILMREFFRDSFELWFSVAYQSDIEKPIPIFIKVEGVNGNITYLRNRPNGQNLRMPTRDDLSEADAVNYRVARSKYTHAFRAGITILYNEIHGWDQRQDRDHGERGEKGGYG